MLFGTIVGTDVPILNANRLVGYDIIGGVINLKPASITSSLAVLIVISPVAPTPNTAEIVVGDTTVNDFARVPPNCTAVAPVKFVPVIVTVCPDAAEVGEKEVIVGVNV
jgi:hypothetical protein